MPRKRRLASVCSRAPVHSMRESGLDSAWMSNCKFCRNEEVVLGPVAGSFDETMKLAKVEPFGHQQAIHNDAPGKRRCLRVSGEAQVPAHEPAHSHRIANANLIGARVEHVVQRPFSVGHRAANGEASAAAFRDDVIKHHASRVKIEIAGHVAQPRREIAVAQRSALDVNLAVEARSGQVPATAALICARPLASSCG